MDRLDKLKALNLICLIACVLYGTVGTSFFLLFWAVSQAAVFRHNNIINLGEEQIKIIYLNFFLIFIFIV
jgi:hypothetical protein